MGTGTANLKKLSRVNKVWREHAKGPKTTLVRAWSPLVFSLGLGKLIPNLAAPEARMDLAQTPTTTVDNHLRYLWISSTFCDLTIVLRDGNEIHVHKSVVSRCLFLSAACRGSFKEALENCIQFPDDDETAILGMIMHLYGFDEIDWCRAVFIDELIPGPVTMELYKVALKYDLPHLASGALNLFTDSVEKCIRSLVKGRNRDPFGFMLGAARYLYEDEDGASAPLLEEFLVQIRLHWDILKETSEDYLRGLVEGCPRLAADLLLDGNFQHDFTTDLTCPEDPEDENWSAYWDKTQIW